MANKDILDIMAFEWLCEMDKSSPTGVKETVLVYVDDNPEEGNKHLVGTIKEVADLLRQGIRDRDLDLMMQFHSKYGKLIEDLKPKEGTSG